MNVKHAGMYQLKGTRINPPLKATYAKASGTLKCGKIYGFQEIQGFVTGIYCDGWLRFTVHAGNKVLSKRVNRKFVTLDPATASLLPSLQSP